MKIYWTDGSASPNPGKGGCCVIDASKKEPVFLGRDDNSTNIRMEGAAIYAAIKMAGSDSVEIHSDSEFWKKVLEEYAPKWEASGWKKKTGQIKNLNLVKIIYEEYQNSKVKMVWVKGHAGIELNELCDEWAKNARDNINYGDLKPISIKI